MRNLTKAQTKQHADHVGSMHEKFQDLLEAIETYNEAIEAGAEAVNSALEDLNNAIGEAESFRSDVYSEMESYYDGRSEKWKESDAGERFQSFAEQWSESLDEVEFDMPEPIDPPDCDAAGRLEELPTETD